VALIYTMQDSAAEGVPSASPLVADGKGEGGEPRAVLALLDSDVYRDPRWCANCGGKQTFVEVFETDFGRVGVCLGCGEEKVIQFSRTVA
jgi:hypothetical protein